MIDEYFDKLNRMSESSFLNRYMVSKKPQCKYCGEDDKDLLNQRLSDKSGMINICDHCLDRTN